MPTDRSTAASAYLRPAVIFALVLSAAFARLIPHPPNFTPVGAMALFGGAYFGSRWVAVLAPLGAMLISDALFAVLRGWAFGPMTLVIYGCIAAGACLGFGLRSSLRIQSVATRSFASALLFYLVVNLAVWATSGMYPRTGEGLWACYAAALPFFGNTLAGHAFYGALLFGGFELLSRRVPALAVRPAPLAS